MSRLAYLAALSLLTACTAAVPSGPTPTPRIVYVTPSPAETAPGAATTEPAVVEDPTEQPEPPTAEPSLMSLDGSLTANTEAFDLAGGDWEVAWSVTPLSGECFHAADLETTDGSFTQVAVSGMFSELTIDRTFAYGLEPGRYFFEVISGCDMWGFTVGRPQ